MRDDQRNTPVKSTKILYKSSCFRKMIAFFVKSSSYFVTGFAEFTERKSVFLFVAQCGNYELLLPPFFAKIPWNKLFAKELYSKLIWRKKFCMAVNFSFFHTVACKLCFLITRKYFVKSNFIMMIYHYIYFS